jgi:ParB family chromosome partitioning protein
MSKRVLGRGLEALIPSPKETVKFIELDRIVPSRSQMRKNFDREQMRSLIESIKVEGLLQPIVVRESGDKYEIVFGERRWRAAKEAGLKNIPVIIRDVDGEGQLKLALIENLQREELNPIERAIGYRNLIEEFNLSQGDVAKIVGKKRSSVANTLRLLKLSKSVQDEIAKGTITEGHGRVLVSLPAGEREKLYRRIKGKTFSVRETEKIARRKKKVEKKDANIQYIEEKLQRRLGTKVALKAGRQKGSIIIEYYSPDDLSRILEVLGVKI